MIENATEYASLSVKELRKLVRSRGICQTWVASANQATCLSALQSLDRGEPVQTPSGIDLAQVIADAISGRVQAGLDEDGVRAIVAEGLDGAKDELLELVNAKMASFAAPLVVHVENRATGETKDLGVQHRQFPTLLAMAQARDKDGHVPPIYLHGPAGTGKTTAARKLADALNLPFLYNGAIDSEYKLSGFIDAGGTFRSRPFHDAYSKGGVYLFDELDSSLPSAVLAFNAALANGHADFPIGSVERHADCIILAAGNTCLRGDGSNQGFMRMEMDAAFRDRFVFLDWPIDEDLEAACVPAEYADWLATVRRVRAAVAALGVKKCDITPRATFSGIALLQAGLTKEQVVSCVLRKGLPDSQWAQIQGRC